MVNENFPTYISQEAIDKLAEIGIDAIAEIKSGMAKHNIIPNIIITEKEEDGKS